MSNIETVLEFLESVWPQSVCDGCISVETNVKPPQQVNQICNKLFDRHKISRTNGVCARDNKTKTVNAVSKVETGPKLRPPGTLRGTPTVQVDVETMRNALVRICQELLQKNKLDVPGALGIGPLISKLYQEGVVPRHQVNMMRTISNLRNAHVFDGIEIGPREASIASGAWEIIEEWLKSRGAA